MFLLLLFVCVGLSTDYCREYVWDYDGVNKDKPHVILVHLQMDPSDTMDMKIFDIWFNQETFIYGITHGDVPCKDCAIRMDLKILIPNGQYLNCYGCLGDKTTHYTFVFYTDQDKLHFYKQGKLRYVTKEHSPNYDAYPIVRMVKSEYKCQIIKLFSDRFVSSLIESLHEDIQ